MNEPLFRLAKDVCELKGKRSHVIRRTANRVMVAANRLRTELPRVAEKMSVLATELKVVAGLSFLSERSSGDGRRTNDCLHNEDEYRAYVDSLWDEWEVAMWSNDSADWEHLTEADAAYLEVVWKAHRRIALKPFDRTEDSPDCSACGCCAACNLRAFLPDRYPYVDSVRALVLQFVDGSPRGMLPAIEAKEAVEPFEELEIGSLFDTAGDDQTILQRLGQVRPFKPQTVRRSLFATLDGCSTAIRTSGARALRADDAAPGDGADGSGSCAEQADPAGVGASRIGLLDDDDDAGDDLDDGAFEPQIVPMVVDETMISRLEIAGEHVDDTNDGSSSIGPGRARLGTAQMHAMSGAPEPSASFEMPVAGEINYGGFAQRSDRATSEAAKAFVASKESEPISETDEESRVVRRRRKKRKRGAKRGMRPEYYAKRMRKNRRVVRAPWTKREVTALQAGVEAFGCAPGAFSQMLAMEPFRGTLRTAQSLRDKWHSLICAERDAERRRAKDARAEGSAENRSGDAHASARSREATTGPRGGA
jgi:hypothetical protein